jgi:hypothetical protein
MSPAGSDLVCLSSSIVIPTRYDSRIRAELFSPAISTAAGHVVIVDPIPLAPAPLSDLRQFDRIQAIVSTNVNHRRAAKCYAARFSASIFARQPCFPGDEPVISIGDKTSGRLEVIEIDGASITRPAAALSLSATL